MKVRVASAGTGKTTSLVLRYLNLVASGVPLRRVAGVTFTRAAADELRVRVGGALRELISTGSYLDVTLAEADTPKFEEALRELDGATLTTIHGFMIQCLRLVAPTLGLDPAFGVLGEWEAQAMFEEELASVFYLAADESHALHKAKLELGDEASDLNVRLFGLRSLTEQYRSDTYPAHSALQNLFEAAYRRFEVRLGASLLPPGEVERRALRLVKVDKAVKRVGSRYQLVLVDEFQDVNPLQGKFFEALEKSGVATEVVGDPKQSIYGFRNADVRVFRRALARGQALPPLTHTRRHAEVLARFLNRLTQTLASEDLGFGSEEAPPVEPAGEQAEVQGRIELHWISGEEPIGELRVTEAAVLAERLQAAHAAGVAYRDMAVLARAYAGLRLAEDALNAAGIPSVMLQGRGYFERLEVRDLYHALRAGLEPKGLSLAAWLRGPYAQLDLPEVDAILKSDDPLQTLVERHPEVRERLDLISAQARGTPLGAIKFLVRKPFINGKRYIDFLDARARENVDALLFTVAQQPPLDIELLLERLNLLSRQTDAGDVPQSGEGVQLLTVHRSKGLEWPLVAVFDAGRATYHPPQDVHVHPETGHICCRDSETFAQVDGLIKERAEAESYRLLYVAASRARDALIITGSVKNDRPSGWVQVFVQMGLGHDAKPYNRPDFLLQTHPYRVVAAGNSPHKVEEGLEPASYIDRSFRHFEHPPVTSPSRLKSAAFEEAEPLPFSDPDEGERLPGRATTVGTLTHYAISQNWRSSNPVHLDNLRAQEVMFPYTLSEQDDILDEVKALLSNYEALLGNKLPSLEARSFDEAELGMALPVGSTIWQGIIDRFYCADGVWVLEDYKTDQVVRPETYYFQLAVYWRAIRQVRGVTPRVQLVYLRSQKIAEVAADALEAALNEHLPVAAD